MTNIAEPRETAGKRPAAPGFLFEPLGWMSRWLAAVIDAEPALMKEIYFLSRQRMHLAALAVAHLGGSQGLETPRLLLRGPVREILDRMLGRRPRGLKRVLGKLPAEVLPPESYRCLLNLLDDPSSFKFLAHADSIGRDDLQMLADIPAALRPLLIPLVGPMGRRGVHGIIEGLRLLVARGAAPSFEALIAELRPLRQPPQLSAHIGRLVDSLPLLGEMPPPQIGPARRLDSPIEIRDLARRWRNCLESTYLSDVDDGKCAVYLWDDAEAPVACLVVRYGRLGWFFDEAKGPRNASLEPERLSLVRRTFEEAGIPRDIIAYSIRMIIELGEEARTGRRGHPL